MPGKSDIPAEIKPGDPILASTFNPIFQLARKHSQSPGRFISGMFDIARPIAYNKSAGVNIIHGLAVGAVSGGDFTIDNIELKNGIDPREDPDDTAETVDITNPFEWDIDDNGLVRAVQADDEDGTWIAVQAKCPE